MKPYWLDLYKQTDLFGTDKLNRIPSRTEVYVIIGQFFEVLAREILGGELGDVDPVNNFQPDLIIWNKNGESDIIVEVKGCNHKTGYGALIDDDQIEFYEKLETSTFPYNNPNALYCIFYYQCDGIRDKGYSVNKILSILAGGIIDSFLVSVLYMREICSPLKSKKYHGWKTREDQTYKRLSYSAISKHRKGSYTIQMKNVKIGNLKINNFPLCFLRKEFDNGEDKTKKQ